MRPFMKKSVAGGGCYLLFVHQGDSAGGGPSLPPMPIRFNSQLLKTPALCYLKEPAVMIQWQ